MLEVLLAVDRRDRRSREIEALAEARSVSISRLERAELARRIPGRHRQDCAALLPAPASYNEADVEGWLEQLEKPLLLVLDGVQDPHNLGACLRSAAAAAADAVIVPKNRAAGLSPAVRKVAAGGAELVPLVQVTNLSRCLRYLGDAGLYRVGAGAQAPQPIHEVDLSGPLALVLGGEQAGLRRLTAEHCDAMAAIPMPGAVASLNVSVAAGVCLFEALRQRR
ncbi:MAG: 23S rRNA (guanosine(2251)-2'-O)-methyltransferase RlmB [Salinisphaera sp.]|nr:23S rRNA (guanosine(2251)-2'-O)-methyltransferase RlmB [Salinisphaera sp.]